MGQKRVIQGTVISDKMEKTVVVRVERRKKHRLYHKVVTFTTHYKAHDETNACNNGDEVRIIESRPYSKEKRWRVLEILTRGDVAEVQPEAIGREIETTTQVAAKREDEVASVAAEEATP
jgi:small subunit ribosomal protein S17